QSPDCHTGSLAGVAYPGKPPAQLSYDARMAAQASFDITSSVDLQEVDNAVNQAKKELAQRYDFKGSKSTIDFKRAENLIELVADDNFKMEALWDVLQTRMVRRGVPVKNLKPSDIEPIAGGLATRAVTTPQGNTAGTA